MSGHATINRLYRLVWSETLGAWVAVAENTRGRGKRSGRKLLAALFAGLGGTALAHAGAPPPAQLPTGGQVVAGTASIGQQGALMTINQATQRAAIDWQTFNVGSQAQVNFVQPSASAVTLNRVLDTQASQIHGRITANGQVFLSNPNGVYFSPTASADVGGLVATTHGIDSADFMAGSNTFTRNGATGSVVNEGQLNAGLGGYIALLAPQVRNSGVVVAQAGTVALASGEAISLQFDARQSLVGVLVTPSQIDALVENGNAVRAPGGMIVMSAQAAQQLQDGVVRNSGTLAATGLTAKGGKIMLDSSGLVDNSGVADASGTQGGAIAVNAGRMLNTGALRADGGGSVTEQLGGLVETAGAKVSATGGGTISVDTGAGQLYTSGSYDVTGQRGGSVTLTGANVALMGAQVDASGDAGGGSIRVGGDFHGANAQVRNAGTTTIGNGVMLAADALRNGDGGKVVVWSDDTTRFGGTVSAKGGADGGNGGQMEVSGKQTLHFAGSASAAAPKGVAGELLLDPKDIIIDANLAGQREFLDPHSTGGGTFGAVSVPLSTKAGATTTSTGYVVVTNPTDNLGASNAGAVYLFRTSDQALISTLYGDHANDKVGSNVTALTNGNFVVGSNFWNGGMGAATWGNGLTGWGANATVVSAANSLVGSSATDAVGGSGQVKALVNGNYIVADGAWNSNRGAVAFGNGASGSAGVIGAANSLVGSTASSGSGSYQYGDQIGSSVQLLPNGNYVLTSTGWNMGVGALTLGSGTSATTGVVGAANSLVGDTSRADASGNGSGTDKVGFGFQLLSGSQFITNNINWNNQAGAITSFDGVTPVTGVVSAANSLVGNAFDNLGNMGVNVLANKNAYVITSSNWNNSRGAVTYVPFSTNVKNVSIAANGLTGTAAGDGVGLAGVTVLANQDYVVATPGWNGSRGAVTLVDGSTGRAKVNQQGSISAANSIVGATGGDLVGYNGTLALTGNGNFVALSPYWSNSTGAVTWSSGSTPTVGVVSGANSVVGAASGDHVGSLAYNVYFAGNATPFSVQTGSVTALANGNFAISSPNWNGNRGAVTWGNGATGSHLVVGAANSLVGSSANDFVGGFLTSQDQAGTQHYDVIGNGITALANGSFVTTSNYWNNGAATKAGAVSWSDGTKVGAVSAANSLVGSTANDMVGTGKSASNGITLLQSGYDSAGKILYSGNYVVTSALWNNGPLLDAGAVTWGSGSAALTGTIGAGNSVLGQKANDVAAWTVTPLAVNGNYLIANAAWTNGGAANAGALTWVNGANGRLSDYATNANANVVSAANSLVGTHANDRVGSSIDLLKSYDSVSGVNEATGNYVARSTAWTNGSLSGAGAVTWGAGATGVAGTISTANSIVGQKQGDALGTTYLQLSNGNYVVANAKADIGGVVNAGAVALVDGSTGHLGDYAAQGSNNILSAANSMVGSNTGDKVGTSLLARASYGPRDLANPAYFIGSTSWNFGAGAFTYVADASHAAAGVVGATNSALGNPNGNLFGGLTTSYKVGLDTGNTAFVTFGGGGGHVVLATSPMPAGVDILLPGMLGYGDAAAATQMMTPNYVANIMRTGTRLTLQANNDINIKSGIDATGGTAGGGLTLRAGRNILIDGDIVTGNRDLSIIANDSVADGVVDAYRANSAAIVSMSGASKIDAGTGAVDIKLAASTDKTFNDAGVMSLNSITASTITVDHRAPASALMLNSGAVLKASAGGTAVTLSTTGAFYNNAGAGAIVTSAPGARWLVYADSPATSYFSGLDSGNTAVWNKAYTGAAEAASGNRYVFRYQPTIVVGTQDVVKTYGDDLSGAALGSRVISLTGVQAGVAHAFAADSAADAISGAIGATSAGAAATANASATPYDITVDLSGVTGNNGYAVALGSNTTRTVTVNRKALSASLNAVSKQYDGSTAATLAASDYVLTGLVGSESFVVGKTSGSFNVAGVGASSVGTTLAAGDFSAANGALASNYVLPTTASGSASITPKALTASVTATKVYDGNANAALNTGAFTLGGFVGAESATVSKTSGAFNAAGVQSATTVSTTLSGDDFVAGSGTSLANYVLPALASGTGLITPKALQVGLTLTGKQYDGNADAVLTGANYNLTGFVSGQSASIGKTTGSYNSASAATANTVSTTLGAADYTAASGTDLSNYTLPTLAAGSAAITRAPLTVSANSAAKIYNGVAWNGGNGVTVSGLVGGETSAVLDGALTYGGSAQGARNAGTYTIAPGGYSSANYAISYNDGQLQIGKRLLGSVASLVGNPSKVYDGGAIASLNSSNFSVAGFVSGEGATVTKTTGLFDSKNAGARSVTVSLAAGDFTGIDGTLLSNYVLPTSATGAGAITPKSVTLTAPAVTKVYDGGTAYSASAGDLAALGASLVEGDTVSAAALAYANRNAGAGNRTVNLTAATVNDGNDGANYSVTLAGNSISTITPRALHVSATGIDRTYDAGTAASVTLGDDRVSGDLLTVANTGAQFADKNAGNGKAISVTGIQVGGADSANYALASSTASASANIARAQLAVTGVNAVGRVYNAGTAVALSGAPTVAPLGSDEVVVGGTALAHAADKNVGQGKAVTVTGYTISDTNYTLVQPTGLTVDITPATLALGGLGVASKTYDGARNATLTGAASVTGFDGEVVTVGGAGVGQFSDKNAGNGKAVTVSGFVSSDSNYLIGQQAGLAGNITPAQLSINGVPASSKVYDGGTFATFDSGAIGLSGFVPGEGAGVTKTTGLFDSKNAGARSVTVSLAGGDFAAASGTLLGNYVLPTSATGTGTITPKSVTLTAPSVTKVYDGGTAYSASAGDLAAIGASLVEGDMVGAASLAYADKNAGAGNRTVHLTAATISDGNNGANYAVTLAGNSSSTITPRALHVSASGINRTYDAGTGASVTLDDDRVAGDVLTVANSGAQFADKNAGNGKAISVTGIQVGGVDSGNYALASSTAGATADIARAQLAVTGVTAVGRVYNTGTSVALSGAPVVAPLGSDEVVVGGTAIAHTADKNAGQGKAVTVTGYTISDTNYTLVQPTGVTVDITPAVLALGGLNVAAKTYDGTRNATLTGAASVAGLNGEVVTVGGVGVGQFSDKNAGKDKAVTTSGFVSSDSNYVIGQQAGLAGDITPALLNATTFGAAKVYDGGTLAGLNSGNFTLTGFVGGEGATVTKTSGLFDSKNAGARTVTVNLGAGDFAAADGTLLANYVLPASATGTGTITPKSVTLAAPSVTKVYDGGTGYSASADDLAALGASLAEGDAVGAASLAYADKNAGAGNRTVNLTAATINDGNNGANYAVTLAGNGSSTITPRTLHVSATGINRTYDAGTSASVTLADDRLAGDILTVASTDARFADKNAGAAKAIMVSGIHTAGADADNYALASTSAGATADIARAALAVTGVSAVARAYDTGTSVALGGVATVKPLGSDVVTVGGAGVAHASDKNVGQGKAVTVTGYTISDSNYALAQPTGLTVDITPAVLALGGLNVATKTYDATRNATLTGTASVTGLNGEVVTLAGTGVGQFGDKNVGNGKAVSVSGYVSSDSNYVVGQQPGLAGSITPATLTVSGVKAVDKDFDGKTSAGLSGVGTIAPIGADAVVLSGERLASFATADVGIDKDVTVSGYSLAGADAGNYFLVQPAGLTASINALPVAPPPAPVAAPAMPAPPLTVQLSETSLVLNTPAAVAAVSVAPATVAASGVSVSVVREVARQQSGIVAVSVPKEIVNSGASFSFALPAQMIEAAAVNREQVTATTTTGAALPAWLSYDNASKTFTATGAPEGSLPVQVLVTIGVQQAVIVISERSE